MTAARTRMHTGAFRSKVLIEQQVRTEDGYGGFSTAYSAVGSVWCAPEALGFRERLYEGVVQHSEDFNLVFRRCQTWALVERQADQLRFTYNGAQYRVANVVPMDFRKEFVKLRVTKYGGTAAEAPASAYTGTFDGSAAFNGAQTYTGV